MIQIPARLREVSPFQAVEVFQAARILEEKGRAVTHLEFGESDLPTPGVVKKAAIKAMMDGHTRYTHSMGIPELRQAICDRHRLKYGTEISPDQVLVSMGKSPKAWTNWAPTWRTSTADGGGWPNSERRTAAGEHVPPRLRASGYATTRGERNNFSE